jgi:hypothetical protein
MYEDQAALDKFFNTGHYMKNMTRRCPSEADFTTEASQQWPEKELKHRRQLQNQAWPLQTEKFNIAIRF